MKGWRGFFFLPPQNSPIINNYHVCVIITVNRYTTKLVRFSYYCTLLLLLKVVQLASDLKHQNYAYLF